MANKLFYSYESTSANEGYVPADALLSYYHSIIFDENNRTAWYKGMPFGSTYQGAVRAEIFNDYDNNTPRGAYSAAFGEHTKTSNSDELSIGRWNQSTDGSIFNIGIGTAENDRKNLLTAYEDGTTYLPYELYSYITYSYIELSNPTSQEESFITAKDLAESQLVHPLYNKTYVGIRAEYTIDGFEPYSTVGYFYGNSYIDIPQFPGDTGINVNIYTRHGNVAEETDDQYGNGLGTAKTVKYSLCYNNIPYQVKGFSGKVAYTGLVKFVDPIYNTSSYTLALHDGKKFAYEGATILDNEVTTYFAYANAYLYKATCKYTASSPVSDLIGYIRYEEYDNELSDMYLPELVRIGKYIYDDGIGKYTKENCTTPEPSALYYRRSLPIVYIEEGKAKKMYFIKEASNNKYYIDDIEVSGNINYIELGIPSGYSINNASIVFADPITHTEYDFVNATTNPMIDTAANTELYSKFGATYTVYKYQLHGYNSPKYSKGTLKISNITK